MQWKKAKQDVLRKGTPEEQKIAAEQISEVTALYKEAVKIVAAPEMMTEAERMASVHGKDKSGNANWGKTKDTSYWQRNSYSSDNNNSDNNNKPIMIASVLILVICVCGGLYLFKDNNFNQIERFGKRYGEIVQSLGEKLRSMQEINFKLCEIINGQQIEFSNLLKEI